MKIYVHTWSHGTATLNPKKVMGNSKMTIPVRNFSTKNDNTEQKGLLVSEKQKTTAKGTSKNTKIMEWKYVNAAHEDSVTVIDGTKKYNVYVEYWGLIAGSGTCMRFEVGSKFRTSLFGQKKSGFFFWR